VTEPLSVTVGFHSDFPHRAESFKKKNLLGPNSGPRIPSTHDLEPLLFLRCMIGVLSLFFLP
jgi:hypothetical protein